MIRLNKVGGKALRQSLSLKNRKTHDNDTLTFYGKQYVHTHTHTHTHTNGHTYIYKNAGFLWSRNNNKYVSFFVKFGSLEFA